MLKALPTVVASLLVGTLVVLSQAPDGAVPAGKAPGGKTGPDAVVANLVNTVCASCHTLDRVNNKKGDSVAWTTTVNNMKEKGAALTDEQVPLLVEYLVRTAGNFTITFTAPDGAAKGGGGKKGGKGKGGVGLPPRTSRCSLQPPSRQPCKASWQGWAFWIRELAGSATSTTGPPMKRWRR